MSKCHYCGKEYSGSGIRYNKTNRWGQILKKYNFCTEKCKIEFVNSLPKEEPQQKATKEPEVKSYNTGPKIDIAKTAGKSMKALGYIIGGAMLILAIMVAVIRGNRGKSDALLLKQNQALYDSLMKPEKH